MKSTDYEFTTNNDDNRFLLGFLSLLAAIPIVIGIGFLVFGLQIYDMKHTIKEMNRRIEYLERMSIIDNVRTNNTTFSTKIP